jgi:hypothetical protein
MSKNLKQVVMYGNKGWQEITAKVGAWFISGEVEYFTDKQSALDWLINRE